MSLATRGIRAPAPVRRGSPAWPKPAYSPLPCSETSSAGITSICHAIRPRVATVPCASPPALRGTYEVVRSHGSASAHAPNRATPDRAARPPDTRLRRVPARRRQHSPGAHQLPGQPRMARLRDDQLIRRTPQQAQPPPRDAPGDDAPMDSGHVCKPAGRAPHAAACTDVTCFACSPALLLAPARRQGAAALPAHPAGPGRSDADRDLSRRPAHAEGAVPAGGAQRGDQPGRGLAGAAGPHAVPVRSAQPAAAGGRPRAGGVPRQRRSTRPAISRIGQTPLGILLADHVRLQGDVTVTAHAAPARPDPGSLVRTASPGDGTLTLIFADNPLALRQWTVLDAQRQETRVTLYNVETGRQLRSRSCSSSSIRGFAARASG